VSGDLKERIEAMLAGLGDTADAVADSLRAKGIKGNASDGESCPVANLITAEFPEASNGAWGVEDEWWVEAAYVRTPEGRVSTPPAVKEFIAAFDDGVPEWDGEFWETDYPFADLDEEGGERW
jgi:hypothetical protein